MAASEEKIIDLCNKGLYYLTIPLDCNHNSVILLDYNKIRNFENILGHRDIICQLSVANNCLITLKGLSHFRKLCVLNLSNNFIDKIEDFLNLKNLTWLNLSGNQIKIIENLDENQSLEHLDLSHNCIQTLGNLSHLHKLKSLLLHGNLITSFESQFKYFPVNLLTLSLAENDITDIKQIGHLTYLTDLEQLSVMGNPCARRVDSITYEKYILSCCKNLKVLDGTIIHNPTSLVEKSNHSISIMNKSPKSTQLHLKSIFPDKAQLQPTNINFPISPIQDGKELKFKKNLFAVPYSTHFPEQITYKSKQEVLPQEDDKGKRTSFDSDSLCPSIQSKADSLTGITKSNCSNMEPERHGNEATLTLDAWNRLESKYEAYDNRPVRPLNKGFYKAISDTTPPRLSCSPPQPSVKEPVISSKKKIPQEFVSQAFNCDESRGQEVQDKCNPFKKAAADLLSTKDERKQRKTELNSVRKKVVKTNAKDIPKKSLELSRSERQENNLVKDQLTINEQTLNTRKELETCSPHSDEQSSNSNISTRNNEIKVFPDHSSTLTTLSFSVKNPLLSSTIPTVTTMDSAFGSQGNIDDQLCMHQAATQIQALWRGFKCRNLNPLTKHVYMELRYMRAQQNITKLSSDLKQQKATCEQKNNLLKQLLEIVQLMWKELQLNRNSKQSDFAINSFNDSPGKSGSNDDHNPTTVNASLENLQQTCDSLSIQVKHLHETLHTFMAGNILCHPANNTEDHPELHLMTNGPTSPVSVTNTGYWSFVLEKPTPLAKNGSPPELRQETISDFDSFVPVPDCLTLLPLSKNSVMLSWSPSTTVDESIFDTLIGYKIYINNHPMAFVPANQTQLIISNLNIYITYNIYVTTISTLKESRPSQKLIANYCMKSAVKEKDFSHFNTNEIKPKPNEIKPKSNEIKPKSNEISNSNIDSNHSKNFTKLETVKARKKPTIAEVVDQRFCNYSKSNLPEKNRLVSPQEKIKHFKKKSKSLENVTNHLNYEVDQGSYLLSEHSMQSVSVFSDEEDSVVKSNKTSKRENNRLITLLNKLYSFSVLQNKTKSV